MLIIMLITITIIIIIIIIIIPCCDVIVFDIQGCLVIPRRMG